jgi:3-hydroxyisobutyrate dehydrogenase
MRLTAKVPTVTVPPITPSTTRIGWIGTGVMGRSMCGHLLRAGYATTVFNRTREKAQSLLDAGARWAANPGRLAEVSDVVFTMVGYPADVLAVILGPDGVFSGLRAGAVLVDMTTSEPSLAVEIAQAAVQRNVWAVDAPVSGGDVGAREATLSIMAGGDAEVIDALMPCFNVLGKTIVRQGGPGAGQHAKMVNQILIAGNMVGLCEALVYAYRAGLDLRTVLRSVAFGAAGSWSLSNLGPRIIDNRFEPGFFVEHFIKDLGIALDESRRMGLSMPGLALAHQLYMATAAQGHARDGTHALQLAIAAMAGMDWRTR